MTLHIWYLLLSNPTHIEKKLFQKGKKLKLIKNENPLILLFVYCYRLIDIEWIFKFSCWPKGVHWDAWTYSPVFCFSCFPFQHFPCNDIFWNLEILPNFIVYKIQRVGLTANQFYLPSLTSLSVAACSRLQLRVANLCTSVALLKIVDNCLHKQWL